MSISESPVGIIYNARCIDIGNMLTNDDIVMYNKIFYITFKSLLYSFRHIINKIDLVKLYHKQLHRRNNSLFYGNEL